MIFIKIKKIFPVTKEYAYNAGNPSLIPGLGRSPGEGNGYPLQYSCLENPMDRFFWAVTVHGVAESEMTEWPNTSTFKIKNIRASKDAILKMRKQVTCWKKIFSKHVSDKGLISRIYIDVLYSIIRQTTQLQRNKRTWIESLHEGYTNGW